jgi:predicted secreted acid phosphatase
VKRTGTILGVALALWISGCAINPGEPENLSRLKEQILRYVDSGRYAQQIENVSSAAIDWIEQRVQTEARNLGAGKRRLAVVFDIDETMLSNLPYMRAMDFGYQPAAWTAWVARGEAPPLEPVREIFQRARRLGVEAIFITGRRERDQAGTEKNLRAIGTGDYLRIFFMGDDATETAEKFKTATRARLVSEGWILIANVGDQASDLAGGFAEKTFKLPAPFYRSK